VSQDTIPALRPVEAVRIQHEGVDYLLLRDPQGLAPEPLLLPMTLANLLRFFDGQHTLRDVQLDLTRSTGHIATLDEVRSFVDALDRNLMLASEAFRQRRRELADEYRALPCRPARFAGEAYAADPEALRRELAQLYATPGAPGLPVAPVAAARLPAAIAAPHIDVKRGAACYAHAYATVWGAHPKRVILLGVNHAGSRGPFVLTTKDYTTPLGTLPTDAEFVRGLADGLQWDPLAEEELHRWEHSLEFQVLSLQHALAQGEAGPAGSLPCIVPILCSFPWPILAARDDLGVARALVDRFLAKLRGLAGQDPDGLLVIAGVDLAHVGRRFGDPHAPSESEREALQRRDLATLELLTLGDRGGFVEETVRERDARRICGFAALYSLLALLPDARGRVLNYGQSVEDATGSVVSFAAVRFDRAGSAG
jgi:MEMO1 family protein